MSTTQSDEEICNEIAQELQDAAKWLSSGELSPGQFRLLLLSLEKRKLERHGMKLSSRISIEGVVHFTLRFSDNGEMCAEIDVDPMNGKLSTKLAC